jgi:hypothetical protein
MEHLRVQFIHGLESSPQSAKAQLLAAHFVARTPAMDTADFEGCVALQASTLAEFRPDVLVGSSFGAAVAVELLRRGMWRGPTLLLAQAALRRLETLMDGAAPQPDEAPWLPEGVQVWLVHGLGDELIDPDDSRRLARSGSPERVRLIEVDDDHALHRSVASGQLVEWVLGLAAAARD